MESLIPLFGIVVPLIGLPWLILHYVTRWKANASLTAEDENLLDDLYHLARRLDDRMNTIERILAAENPNWNGLGHDRGYDRQPALPSLEKRDPVGKLEDLERRVDRLGGERSPLGRA